LIFWRKGLTMQPRLISNSRSSCLHIIPCLGLQTCITTPSSLGILTLTRVTILIPWNLESRCLEIG
jgi:hypothetical protein